MTSLKRDHGKPSIDLTKIEIILMENCYTQVTTQKSPSKILSFKYLIATKFVEVRLYLFQKIQKKKTIEKENFDLFIDVKTA